MPCRVFPSGLIKRAKHLNSMTRSPLLIYLIGLVFPIDLDTAFAVSIALSAIALFGLGATKVFVTHLSPLRSGLEMLLVGGLAALVAYVIGALLKNVGG
jgi:VIT1/CCC1 family predicted Fe2+/Mn2+ transporter